MQAVHRAFLAALIASGLAASPAQAQSPQPIWIAAPAPEAMTAAYPAAAKAAKLGGRAVLSCLVTPDGALDQCHAVSETPADQGFAAAALTLAPAFRMKTELKDGTPAAGLTFNIPIRFAPPEPEPEAGPAQPSIREPVFGHAPPGRGGPGPYFPDRAFRLGQRGAAIVQCRAAADGALSDCVVLGEKPDNWGFGDATRAMIRRGFLKASPRLEDGKPVDGETVLITVPFRVGR